MLFGRKAMTTKRTAARLAAHQQRYRDLARQLADIGYIASGSVAPRFNRCGKTNCACHADPPSLHGPYWQWTAKINGKTVNRRLTQRQAELYSEWISNDRQARALLAQMRDIAAKATQLILEDAARG
jgi:hypothetical protein